MTVPLLRNRLDSIIYQTTTKIPSIYLISIPKKLCSNEKNLKNSGKRTPSFESVNLPLDSAASLSAPNCGIQERDLC